MKVYRVQSRSDRTRGAYCSPLALEPSPKIVKEMAFQHNKFWVEGIAKGVNNHPGPSDDYGINRNMRLNEHCGFDSAAKLLRWFKGFIPELLRAGYEIVVLQDVTVTAVGEHQVLFIWNE